MVLGELHDIVKFQDVSKGNTIKFKKLVGPYSNGWIFGLTEKNQWVQFHQEDIEHV